MIQHLAVIMDGNRRWAKKQGLMPWLGHKEGVQAVRRALEFCIEKQIPLLTLYTLSLENFKRPAQEIEFLLDILLTEPGQYLAELKSNGIKVLFVGDRKLFPERVIKAIAHIETETASGTALTVNLLFCYGGRQEIVAAVQAYADDLRHNKAPQELTEDIFYSYLWTGKHPDPDLIIRTGDACRLSNFLLFQGAYSELYFTSKLWPEITKDDLAQACEEFYTRKRNFGG